MNQRTLARIGIWLMILAGIWITINLFVVSYFEAIVAQMGTKLPFVARIIFNLSSYIKQNGLLLTLIYAASFVAITIWYRTTKPRQDKT